MSRSFVQKKERATLFSEIPSALPGPAAIPVSAGDANHGKVGDVGCGKLPNR